VPVRHVQTPCKLLILLLFSQTWTWIFNFSHTFGGTITRSEFTFFLIEKPNWDQIKVKRRVAILCEKHIRERKREADRREEAWGKCMGCDGCAPSKWTVWPPPRIPSCSCLLAELRTVSTARGMLGNTDTLQPAQVSRTMRMGEEGSGKRRMNAREGKEIRGRKSRRERGRTPPGARICESRVISE